MQAIGACSTMSSKTQPAIVLLLAFLLLLGCVSHVYNPGATDNPLHQLKLGQNYGDMVKVLGKPDHGHTEDRTGQEAGILFVPVWNIVEAVGNFNPSMMQVYTYDRWGTVTIDNNNQIIRIEGR